MEPCVFAVNIQSIAAPSIQVDELKESVDSFGAKPVTQGALSDKSTLYVKFLYLFFFLPSESDACMLLRDFMVARVFMSLAFVQLFLIAR